jgi:hypothetical protein
MKIFSLITSLKINKKEIEIPNIFHVFSHIFNDVNLGMDDSFLTKFGENY